MIRSETSLRTERPLRTETPTERQLPLEAFELPHEVSDECAEVSLALRSEESARWWVRPRGMLILIEG